jgi:hypothetical protein
MIKEAIEKIIELSMPGFIDNPLEPGIFAPRGRIERVLAPVVAPIKTHSLKGLVDVLRNVNPDDKIFIHIRNHHSVGLVSCHTNQDKIRTVFAEANYESDGFRFNTYMPADTFNISAMACFVPTAELDNVLRLTGNIVHNTEVVATDDGVSQEVAVKSGLARRSSVIIPKMIPLVPYRTFPEVDQVDGMFVLRVRMQKDQSPEIALFEANNDNWKLRAIMSIRSWFEKALLAEDLNEDIFLVA